MSKWISGVLATVVGALVVGFFATLWVDHRQMSGEIDKLKNDILAIKSSNGQSANPVFDSVTTQIVQVIEKGEVQPIVSIGAETSGRGMVQVRSLEQGRNEFLGKMVAGNDGGQLDLRTYDNEKVIDVRAEKNKRGYYVAFDYSAEKPIQNAFPTWND